MSIPGFTAEVSLYSSGRTYRAAAGRSGNSDGQTVVAQQWAPWNRGGCGAGCLRQDRWCRAEGSSESHCNQIFSRCIDDCGRYAR